jgi:hypothetical protein
MTCRTLLTTLCKEHYYLFMIICFIIIIVCFIRFGSLIITNNSLEALL